MGYDIGIEGNSIKENALSTFQQSYAYKGENNCLSEYNGKKIKALEYEVFQIIFNK